ncbi:MAG TPA: YbaY family lipoprotein [Terriglobales bacterium]|nr:YbaY family lipoprotein [Terriglobales bacterium]
MRERAGILACSLALLIISQFVSGQEKAGKITGTVAYRERVALPPNAMLTIRMEDVSKQDVGATLIAGTAFSANGRQVPIPFELSYNPAKISQKGRYVVRANVDVDGELLFTTTQPYPVLNDGASNEVNVMMKMVAYPPPGFTPAGTEGPAAPLMGTEWKLTELGGETFEAPAEGRAVPTLILNKKDKRISGSAGCNRMMGTFTMQGDGLRFGKVATTMMACPEPAMSVEKKFLEALNSTDSYRIDGDTLELRQKDKVLARFKAQPKAQAKKS